MEKVIYGYARVSTKQQKLERQISSIKEQYPDAVIITEKYTGTTTDRPKWNALIEEVKRQVALGSDVTIVFDEVSRMARDAKEGFSDYKTFYDMGVSLVFLKERHIDTDNFRQALQSKVSMTGTDVDIILEAVNEYLMKLAERQIEIAFEAAQKEVDHLRQRTKEGIAKAKIAGVQIGREKGSKSGVDFKVNPRVIKKAINAKAFIVKHSKFFDGDMTDTQCMAAAGISRGTFYKYKKELIQGADGE